MLDQTGNSLVSFPRWAFPPSAPGRRGLRWFWALACGSVRRCPPGSLWGYPPRHPRLAQSGELRHDNNAVISASSTVNCLCCVATSQVFDEVLQLHLPLGFDVGAVHVSVEEDDGECQDEDGVRIPELPHHCGVADAVALAGMGKERRTFSCSTSCCQELL